MATSSLSRDFVISDPKSIDKLIHAMENPVKFKLEKRNPEQEKQRKEKALCNFLAQLNSLTN